MLLGTIGGLQSALLLEIQQKKKTNLEVLLIRLKRYGVILLDLSRGLRMLTDCMIVLKLVGLYRYLSLIPK
jgi:hypothetical protein